jgi:hypothetical protein
VCERADVVRQIESITLMAMRPAALLSLPLRYKPWRARHLRLIARDLFAQGTPSGRAHADHLRAAIDW